MSVAVIVIVSAPLASNAVVYVRPPAAVLLVTILPSLNTSTAPMMMMSPAIALVNVMVADSMFVSSLSKIPLSVSAIDTGAVPSAQSAA